MMELKKTDAEEKLVDKVSVLDINVADDFDIDEI
jgi:hypothetical protein